MAPFHILNSSCVCFDLINAFIKITWSKRLWIVFKKYFVLYFIKWRTYVLFRYDYFNSEHLRNCNHILCIVEDGGTVYCDTYTWYSIYIYSYCTCTSRRQPIIIIIYWWRIMNERITRTKIKLWDVRIIRGEHLDKWMKGSCSKEDEKMEIRQMTRRTLESID